MYVIPMLYATTQLVAIIAHVQWGTLEMEVVAVSALTNSLVYLKQV